jgi:hypothetical protein
MTDSREVTLKAQDIEYLQSLPETLAGLNDNLNFVADKLSEHDSLFDKIKIISANDEPSTDKLFAALAAAQAEIQDADKDSEVDAGRYKYKYATLANVLTAVRPVLSKNGLALSQLPTRAKADSGEVLGLTTILGHESGQSIENYFEMLVPDPSPQGVGSAMTYMRRYVVMAICGIAGADDDDAEKAQPKAKLITAEQADAIFNKADELFGDDSEAMLERMCKKIHMCESVREIPANEYEVALKRIENQAKNRGTKAPEEVEGKSEKKPAKPAKPAKPSA